MDATSRHATALACSMLTFCIALPALAGIAEYNEARARGDLEAAADETELIWADYDRSSSSALTVAVQFAFTNYLVGRYEVARRFTDWAREQVRPATAPVRSSVDDEILVLLVDYRLNPSEEVRAELARLVTARLEYPEWNDIPFVGAALLAEENWTHGRWQEAGTAAGMLAQYAERAGAGGRAHMRSAQLIAIVCDFLMQRRMRHYDELADLHDEIASDVDRREYAAQRTSLLHAMWQTHAWVNAVRAALDSGHVQVGSIVNSELKTRRLRYPRHRLILDRETDVEVDRRPFCEWEFKHRRFRYPANARYKGMVGSVIVAVDFDEKGRASNPTLLASIPVESFGDSVIAAVPTFQRKPKRGEDLDNCKLSERSAIVPVTFIIE